MLNETGSSAFEAKTPVVKMTGIGKRFQDVVALDNVDFELFAGEVHSLAGENGSGKSTLSKVLYGAHRPDRGTIEVDGTEAEFRSPADALSLGIVGISQELTLAPTLTIAENIAMGRLPIDRFRRVDWPRVRQMARGALDRLGIEMDVTMPVGQLGIERQQQVEIARAVCARSRVLVLDEATSSLSERATEALLNTIEELRREGVAIVFISHRLAEIYQVAQRATVLRDGRRVASFAIPETSESKLVRSMVGRELRDLYGDRTSAAPEVVLDAKNLTSLDGRLRSADLEVRAGEVVGVAGLVGSGKAELGLALGGATPSTGQVLIDGKPANLSSPRKAVDSGVAFVSDDRKRDGIFPNRNVEENLSLPWLPRLRFLHFLVHVGAERRMVQNAIKRFGIVASSSAAQITTLSGGNQQKVILGRAFALEPRVLVLSEPTRGVDVGAKEEIYRMIHTMAKEGKAVIMISSELPELLGVANRILVMFRGELRAEFTEDEFTEEGITHVAVGADEVRGVRETPESVQLEDK